MTALAARRPRHVLADSATMVSRNLLHMIRYPSMTLILLGMPVVFLLLFVYVLGGTLGQGIGAAGTPTSPTSSPASSC